MKADFIALTVNHCMSSSVYPKVSVRCSNSWLMLVPLISRLSVFTVMRKCSLRSSPIGCPAYESAAPVWRLEVGHISSGMRLSRT